MASNVRMCRDLVIEGEAVCRIFLTHLSFFADVLGSPGYSRKACHSMTERKSSSMRVLSYVVLFIVLSIEAFPRQVGAALPETVTDESSYLSVDIGLSIVDLKKKSSRTATPDVKTSFARAPFSDYLFYLLNGSTR